MSQDNNPFGSAAPAPQQQAANPYAAAPNGSTSPAPAQNPYAAPRANVATGPDETAEVQSIKDIWLKPSGRIPRKAFWLYFVLPLIVVSMVLGVISAIIKTEALIWIFQIAILYPSIVAGIKRLHDRDMSGWWVLIGFVPFVGALILLVMYCMRGTEGPNRFGGDATGMY
jgi:uncharacterized membrane protein YhaH (DUF805 family)